jgi:bifunctional DNA-binding transcriptional regulator/antitoxin component of YhaV-PrlF toxin-antitoxin module
VDHVDRAFSFEVKEKGRVVLPVGLRVACGFEVGSRLVARTLGPGQAIIETADAVMERIWSGVPTEQTDAVAGLWDWRAKEAERMTLGQPVPADEEASARASKATLRKLGLA